MSDAPCGRPGLPSLSFAVRSGIRAPCIPGCRAGAAGPADPGRPGESRENRGPLRHSPDREPDCRLMSGFGQTPGVNSAPRLGRYHIRLAGTRRSHRGMTSTKVRPGTLNRRGSRPTMCVRSWRKQRSLCLASQRVCALPLLEPGWYGRREAGHSGAERAVNFSMRRIRS